MATAKQWNANSRFTDVNDEPSNPMLFPIEGYEHVEVELLSLSEAIKLLSSYFKNIENKVNIALEQCRYPLYNLTKDESASIYLYTMEFDDQPNFYHLLNQSLHNKNYKILKPWFSYLKLLSTALNKLPSYKGVVWRGSKNINLRLKYEIGMTFTWWGISSCTTSIEALLFEDPWNNMELRTIFEIHCFNGKSIGKHSYFSELDEEIILMPGSSFQVIGRKNHHIIQLKEIEPLFLNSVDIKSPFVSLMSVLSSQFPSNVLTKSISFEHPLISGKEINNQLDEINLQMQNINFDFLEPQQHTSSTNFQFVIIDLSQRLSQLASAMLKSLETMAKESILIIDDNSIVNFDKFTQKRIFLFVSQQFAVKMKNQPKLLGGIFILEDDKNKVDYHQRFDSDIDLIFQLADEIYRCYIGEAKEDSRSGKSISAKKKEQLANQIQTQLKNICKTMSTKPNINQQQIQTETIIIWLTQNLKDNTEIKEIQKLLSTIVSSFIAFDNQDQCQKYLLETQSTSTIFLIVNTNLKDSIQFDNIQKIYYYGTNLLTNKNILKKFNDLCFRLISDLAIHYDQLGSTYSNQNNPKIAKDMFMKTHQLYNILANVK